jgi:hypothetical protein
MSLFVILLLSLLLGGEAVPKGALTNVEFKQATVRYPFAIAYIACPPTTHRQLPTVALP